MWKKCSLIVFKRERERGRERKRERKREKIFIVIAINM